MIVDGWNNAYPDGGPFDLAGWQVAFIAVGLPGLLLALWVMTLKEPKRGAIDGLESPEDPAPFKGFVAELFTVIPPFTLVGAARRGAGALAINVIVFAFFMTLAVLLTDWLDSGEGMLISAITDQWLLLAIGYYAVFCWATSLRERDPATFSLTWGSPAFLSTILGYGSVAFMAYASAYWTAPYAERVFEIDKGSLGFWIGGPSAVAGFLGVTIGGRVADILFEKHPAGRLFVLLFGLVSPIPVAIWLFTTNDLTTFFILAFFAQLLTSSALGAAAATSQALVLPRMRGTATATFFLATTLVGLALGPYLAGYVSATNDGDLSKGVLSTLWIAPIGLILVLASIKLVPAASASLIERARQAGEPV